MTRDKTTLLLAWAEDNHLRLDPRLEIRQANAHISVFSRDFIESNQTLVRIPKSAVLSVKSSRLAPYIAYVPYGHESQLALALALYGELLDRENSPWSGYLGSLPVDIVGIALLWEAVEHSQAAPHQDGSIMDRLQARSWIVGTQVEKEFRSKKKDGASLLADVRRYYDTVVYPLLSQQPWGAPSVNGFYHAYSLVSSRAFVVDAFHGLSMVPIADAFNHSEENQVHLESDYDVCTTCGSTDECPHDDGETVGGPHIQRESGSSCPPPRSHAEEDTYDMVSNSPVLAGDEVFNTYGEDLSNAQLLTHYGFALECNENDVITWSIEELDTFARGYMDGKKNGDLGQISAPPSSSKPSFTANSLAPVWPPYCVSDTAEEDEERVTVSPMPSSLPRSIEWSSSHSDTGGSGSLLPNRWSIEALWTQVIHRWPEDARWHEDSSLVCSPPLQDAASTIPPREFEDPSPTSTTSAPESSRRGNSKRTTTLCLDSDGKISHDLWLYCALLNLEDARWTIPKETHDAHIESTSQQEQQKQLSSRLRLATILDPCLALEADGLRVQKIVRCLRRVASHQEKLEREIEEAMDIDSDLDSTLDEGTSQSSGGDVEYGAEARQADGRGWQQQEPTVAQQITVSRARKHGTASSPTANGEEMQLTSMVARIAQTISSLCRLRADHLGVPNTEMGEGVNAEWSERLQDVLDALTDDRLLTRAAVMVAASERSILESCLSGWDAFGDALISMQSGRHCCS